MAVVAFAIPGEFAAAMFHNGSVTLTLDYLLLCYAVTFGTPKRGGPRHPTYADDTIATVYFYIPGIELYTTASGCVHDDVIT